MNGMRLVRIGLCLVAMLTLAACVGVRSDFPAWFFAHPPQVSSEAVSSDSDMPDIFSDHGENVVVAWSSDPTASPGGSDTEIYWRRYSAMGAPQTSPIRLTNNSFGDYYPSVSMSNGISYLVWMGDEITSSNIYWGAVDQGGNFVAGPQMISDPDYNDYDPHIIQCGNYSNVFWSGNSSDNDYEIYYTKIRYNGIVDIPYKPVSNGLEPEDSPHGETNLLCTQLYIAYENDASLDDTDVYLVGINTDDGSIAFSPKCLACTSSDEKDIDIAVNSPLIGDTLISVVWDRDDGAGGEIEYASRYANGDACASTTPLTNDSQFDARPVVENVSWIGDKIAMVFWERVEAGYGPDRDIYGEFMNDDCTPAPLYPAFLVSESAVSETSEDIYPQVLARMAPDGVPIFATIWRTQSDGAVWSRFGSLAGPIGASDRISDDASEGYPSGMERPAAVASLGNQIYVTWIGDNPGTSETWYQQTAWRRILPIVTK